MHRLGSDSGRSVLNEQIFLVEKLLSAGTVRGRRAAQAGHLMRSRVYVPVFTSTCVVQQTNGRVMKA